MTTTYIRGSATNEQMQDMARRLLPRLMAMLQSGAEEFSMEDVAAVTEDAAQLSKLGADYFLKCVDGIKKGDAIITKDRTPGRVTQFLEGDKVVEFMDAKTNRLGRAAIGYVMRA